MSNQLTRQQRFERINEQPQWDIIIIGGGITGAGIFKHACQLGLKTLLVEQKDFAWGSSSRSSKMVHGGLRYIAQGQIKLTIESVQEREKLLQQLPNLVSPQSFVMGHYQRQFPPPFIFNSLLWVYNLFARKYNDDGLTPNALSTNELSYLVPQFNRDKNLGGTQFSDALTDDARLVLRLIQEGQQLSGCAVNYCKVNHYLFADGDTNTDNSKVVGISATGESIPENLTAHAKVVINATGAWADKLTGINPLKKANKQLTDNVSTKPIKIRPLRGSHIIVPSWRLPVASVVVILHPDDKRPVQVYPWQNVTVIGTTDVEHHQHLDDEAKISINELDYLLAAVASQFPHSQITANDIISTFAGVRPVVAGKSLIDPSKEKRDHSIWQQPGLLTVAGGKLTTFDVIAKQVLTFLRKDLALPSEKLSVPVFALPEIDVNLINKVVKKHQLSDYHYQHLLACYGDLLTDFFKENDDFLLSQISYSRHLWAELVWAVRHEQVQHLDDLLLRRTRLGNVLPEGAISILDKVKTLCITPLAWSENKWNFEVQRYKQLWKSHYSLPLFNKTNNNAVSSHAV